MSDLAEFLAARLDETEAAVKDVRYVWPTSFEVTLNPARVLREVTAMRAILASECAPYPRHAPPMTATMRLLAAIWSDHPDYRPEWAASPTGGPSAAPPVP